MLTSTWMVKDIRQGSMSSPVWIPNTFQAVNFFSPHALCSVWLIWWMLWQGESMLESETMCVNDNLFRCKCEAHAYWGFQRGSCVIKRWWRLHSWLPHIKPLLSYCLHFGVFLSLFQLSRLPPVVLCDPHAFHPNHNASFYQKPDDSFKKSSSDKLVRATHTF